MNMMGPGPGGFTFQGAPGGPGMMPSGGQGPLGMGAMGPGGVMGPPMGGPAPAMGSGPLHVPSLPNTRSYGDGDDTPQGAAPALAALGSAFNTLAGGITSTIGGSLQDIINQAGTAVQDARPKSPLPSLASISTAIGSAFNAQFSPMTSSFGGGLGTMLSPGAQVDTSPTRASSPPGAPQDSGATKSVRSVAFASGVVASGPGGGMMGHAGSTASGGVGFTSQVSFASSGDSPRGKPTSPSGSPSSSPLGGAKETMDEETKRIYRLIDPNGNGYISKLQLIAAVKKHKEVQDFIFPGSDPMSEEDVFEATDSVFDAIASGRQRVKFSEFSTHFRKAKREKTHKTLHMLAIFQMIDTERKGSIAKSQLIAAIERNPDVAGFVLPGIDCRGLMHNERAFEALNRVFENIAGGKRRIEKADWQNYFTKVAPKLPVSRTMVERSSTRVFVIGPGFGLQINPRQGAMIVNAGYQIYWCHSVPNPELPNFPAQPYLDQIKSEIDQFQPDVVACASKGGVYLVGLWEAGYWRGPSLLLNAHPTCKRLPKDVSVVLAQGGNDEVYPTSRADLEALMATGSENRCFLYYCANSGFLPTGQLTRIGDRHNMESILSHDLLPRLVDATLCDDGPEVHVVRSWRDRLGDDRLYAESWLGYTLDSLRKRWTSPRGLDAQKLFEVAPGSEEFNHVVTVFKSAPKEPPVYVLSPQAVWERTQVLSIQRIENGLQDQGSAKPYFESLKRSIEDQDLEFEPGTHTVWGFHGADASAIDSIVSNPVAGFQPLASGTRNSTLWGSGTYFARDAKYVADGGFCGKPAADGTRRMLMCFMMPGMPCLGDPAHKGVLPFRNRPHRYNSSVDSLSSPEIYVIQHPGAAHPVYLITFA